jgi:tyrosine-protein kinase Etk/Wzc
MNTTQDLAAEQILGTGKGFDFKLYMGKVKTYWYWFVLSVLVCFAVSYLYIRYATPLFLTTASVLIKEDATASSGESSLLKAFGGTDMAPVSSTETEAEIFKTHLLMEKVVKAQNANVSYFVNGNVKNIEIDEAPFKVKLIGQINPKGAAAMNVTIKGTQITLSNEHFTKVVALYESFDLKGVGKVIMEKGDVKADPGLIYSFKITPLNNVVSSFLSKLQVVIPSKQVNIIDLSFTSPLPRKSENILNGLIKAYVDGNIIDKNTIADSTISFIDNRLLLVKDELGKVEGNVESFKTQNKVTDIAAQSALLITSSSQSIQDLSKVETQLDIVNSLEKYLSEQGNLERVVPSGVLLEDPNFAALVERYNTIVMEKERSKLSQTEQNPYVQNLNNQIAGARADMQTSLASLKRTLQISKNSLQSRANQMQGEVSSVPRKERTYLDLERQQQIKQELYVFLLQKREETAISKTSNISNCKVIDAPMSVGPVSPNGKMIMAYGVLVGLFLPLGIIYLVDVLNTKIQSKEEINSLTHVPVISEIGGSDLLETIVVGPTSRTPISEQFRNLRTNLSFFLKPGQKKILITSSMSGEGKSFCSINLAATLALTGKKVVVMEMDLRKPNLSNKFNLPNSFGYTNYITSIEVNSKEIVRPSGLLNNLFIISSGPIPPNPAELLIDERIDALMAELEQDFDYIIMDAPPIGLVTDAQLLSSHADLTLYVVRERYTLKEQLSIPEEIYANAKIKNMAILINDVSINTSYGYGYGYGYGSEMQDSKPSLFNKIFRK